MKLGLLLATLLLATQAVAQDDAKTWGCLWVEKNDPGEKLLKWCVIDAEVAEISCYHIEAHAMAPDEDLEPWVVVPAADVTERFAPNDGICPKLPADIPPVDTIRNTNR